MCIRSLFTFLQELKLTVKVSEAITLIHEDSVKSFSQKSAIMRVVNFWKEIIINLELRLKKKSENISIYI